MTKSSKLFRIIALAAIIQFSMTACESLLPVILAQQGPSGSTQQPTAQQATLDKLTFNPNSSVNLTGYRVRAANNQISGAVVIPDTYNGLPVIGISGGFTNCTGITSITIPASIARIDSNSFSGCTNLTSVTFFSGQTELDNLVRFPGDLMDKYRRGGAGIYTRPAGSNTWTRIGDAPITVNTSLDGVWEESNNGTLITFSGSSGTFSRIGSYGQTSWGDAVNKGYIKVGDLYLQNIRSTGNLAWSGQALGVTNNSNNRNVAIGTQWINGTITMSADGRTIEINGSTWTRR